MRRSPTHREGGPISPAKLGEIPVLLISNHPAVTCVTVTLQSASATDKGEDYGGASVFSPPKVGVLSGFARSW